MVSFNQLFTFVLALSRKYNIDSSHSESHSMAVLRFADENYKSQLAISPYLKEQADVIYTASVLHDMCDKKYMNQNDGIQEITHFLQNQIKMKPRDIYYTIRIIETMSYSTVKKSGYPDLDEYQLAYHIVREADLLASYDFDRSMIYHLNRGNSLTDSYQNALELFRDRVFTYNTEKLLLSDYAQQRSVPLTMNAINQMTTWNRILTNCKTM
jgi:HD superfamily phosphodiesterase